MPRAAAEGADAAKYINVGGSSDDREPIGPTCGGVMRAI